MKARGFTIFEILVVVTMIVIVIGTAISRFKGMQEEGRIAKAKGELKTLQAAVESYRLNHLNTSPANITTDLTGAFPQIISTALSDPFSGEEYKYSTNGSYYAISWVVLT